MKQNLLWKILSMILVLKCIKVHAFATPERRPLLFASRHATKRYLSNSVTGPIYTASEEGAPTIRLFTKEGCTLCDKVKDTLNSVRADVPHSLVAVDITDKEHALWYDKYKWDIPVLHVGDRYWTKHRITEDEARKGLIEASTGLFVARAGEPDAAAMERKQAERTSKDNA
jgi:glutaredoxin